MIIRPAKFVKILLFAAMILSGMAALSPDAAAQTQRGARGAVGSLCSSDDPQISVKLATSPTKYIKTQDAYTLTALHNTGSGVTLGLAGGPIDITVQGIFSISSRGGKSCVELEKLNVLFWAKPMVLIANNFQKGSCEYRQVLGHEQKHIRALRKFVRKHAPELQREVKNIIKTTRTKTVVKDAQVEMAQKDLQEPIIKRLAIFQNEILPVLRATQKEIDNPEEYQRVADSCKNWGKKLATGG